MCLIQDILALMVSVTMQPTDISASVNKLNAKSPLPNSNKRGLAGGDAGADTGDYSHASMVVLRQQYHNDKLHTVFNSQ